MPITPKEAIDKGESLRETERLVQEMIREKRIKETCAEIDNSLMLNPRWARVEIYEEYGEEIASLYRQKGWIVDVYKYEMVLCDPDYYPNRFRKILNFLFGK